jgi:hypothetical protein
MRHALRIAVFFSLVNSLAQAASLPGGLSSDDVDRTLKIIGGSTLHRAWTAPAQPSAGLGLQLGVETSFLFRRDLGDLGNGDGVLPRTVPQPRLWAAIELPQSFMASFHFGIGALFDGIESYGTGLQWSFYEDLDTGVTATALVSGTYAKAFGDFTGRSVLISAQVARDLSLWQPYAGLGLWTQNAELSQELALGDPSRVLVLPHLYAGFRLDFLAKLAAQIDFSGPFVSASLMMSQEF